MSPNMELNRGMYFEEFEAGQSFTTVGRTITESDIVMFAGLTGDYNLIHTNAEYSKTTPVGERIAHGMLTLSILSGLAVRTGIMEGTVIVFREITDWKFIKPVLIGDTIYGVMEVMETKALRRLGGGAVSIQVSAKNQKDETIMKGSWNVLMASKPQD